MQTQIKLTGYDFIGEDGNDGIRYVWENERYVPLIESIAFVNKTKGIEGNISGYTTSVTAGCVLKYLGYACKFCRTGAVLPFSGFLSAYDIAKENILMVLMDMEHHHPIDLSTHEREFAYMGQGEPGYSYAQLRLAIKLTDHVMNILGQKVHRHIISTSGVPEMVWAVCDDVKSNYYDSRITMHFSLHSLSLRNQLMPINSKYPYQEVLNCLKEFSDLSREKVCIGMLLFQNFIPKKERCTFTTSINEIDVLLKNIDKEHFRISLCEYNTSSDVGYCEQFSKEKAIEYYDYIKNRGFEVKLFSSFGQKENSACGMLAGQTPQNCYNEELKRLELYADKLIKDAYLHMKK